MGGQNDPFRAGRAPKAAKAASAPRGKADKNTDYSYGQGPRGGAAFQFGLNNANQGGKNPHSDGGYGAQPELKGQAKEDHRRQEHRVSEAMHSSGSGIPAHQYEPTPVAGKVP